MNVTKKILFATINNNQMLKIFARQFILAKFKNVFRYCQIEYLVDNARTHTDRIEPNRGIMVSFKTA